MRVPVPAAALTGLAAGLISSLLGVGGGIVAIPLLLHFMRVRLEHAAATSLAIVAVAATAGAISYMLGSPPAGSTPPGAIGYVHVAAALPIMATAAITVRWGARLNQQLDARRLRSAFAVLFAIVGLQLSGGKPGRRMGLNAQAESRLCPRAVAAGPGPAGGRRGDELRRSADSLQQRAGSGNRQPGG